MDLSPGKKAEDIDIGYIFIGSPMPDSAICSWQLSLSLRSTIAPQSDSYCHYQALVRSSGLLKRIGLDKIFMDAGFEWRDPGCSMCLGMNQIRCQTESTVLRPIGTLRIVRDLALRPSSLWSAMAAAAAIAGHRRSGSYRRSSKEVLWKEFTIYTGGDGTPYER